MISKIKINSMAIVRMKSVDGHEEFQKSPTFPSIDNAFTSSVKQVCLSTSCAIRYSVFVILYLSKVMLNKFLH